MSNSSNWCQPFNSTLAPAKFWHSDCAKETSTKSGAYGAHRDPLSPRAVSQRAGTGPSKMESNLRDVRAPLTNLHPSMRRGWQPLCRQSDVVSTPTAFTLLGQQWVTWRTTDNVVKVFENRCPHRFAPLSLGTCEGDGVRCGYHGWLFDADGSCIEIPALGEGAPLPSRAQLRAPAAVALDHGMVFIAVDHPITDVPTRHFRLVIFRS
jgi:nitrite reductase/ring-hydroxylating ferredoxin subunit